MWSQIVKGVRVEKKQQQQQQQQQQWGFCPIGGVVSWELKRVGSRGLCHSIDLVDMYMHADFI